MTRNEKRLLYVAEQAVEALKVADLYLDGFVWVSEPEFSELRSIKKASNLAQARLDKVRAEVKG